MNDIGRRSIAVGPLCLLTDPILYLPFGQREVESRMPLSLPLIMGVIEEATAAGLLFLQYRGKNATRYVMFETAQKIQDYTRQHHITLIINDQIDLAMAVGADGVHLGQDDLPISIARTLLGSKKIIGVSTHTLDEARQAQSDGANYIGFGPIFRTETKAASLCPVGVEAIRKIKQEVSLPLYAIGGVTTRHLVSIRLAGADGVAVISGVAGAVGRNITKWLSCWSEGAASDVGHL